jgi:hypothetical protein
MRGIQEIQDRVLWLYFGCPLDAPCPGDCVLAVRRRLGFWDFKNWLVQAAPGELVRLLDHHESCATRRQQPRRRRSAVAEAAGGDAGDAAE